MAAVPEPHYIRVAIAICALKFRPPEQSYTSYVLDLRAKFLGSRTGIHSQDEGALWREHALSVERDLVDLQARYQNDHVKLLALGAAIPASGNESITPVPSSNKKVKKKKVLQTLARSARIDLEAVLTGHTDQPCIPSIPGHDSLFTAFYALNQLVHALDEQQPVPIVLLTATANRAMEAMRVTTQAMSPPQSFSHTPANTLQMVSTMLSYLLSVVFPLIILHLKNDGEFTAQELTVDAAIDQFLRRLALVLIPVIRSFAPLSRSTLWNVFSADKTSEEDVQFQGTGMSAAEDLLSLLRRAVSTLDQVCFHMGSSLVDGLRETLALEAVRELEKASLDSRDGSSNGQGRRYSLEKRVSLLATKDTIWYMCNILHLVFTPTLTPVARSRAVANESGQNFPLAEDELLKNGILKSFSDLILRSRLCSAAETCKDSNEVRTSNGIIIEGGQPVDEVGQCMILGVAEKVWLHWFGQDASVSTGQLASTRPFSQW